MDFVLRDLREFPDLAHSGFDSLFGRCISLVRYHYNDPGHQCPHLTQNTDAAMRPLRKVYGFLTAEKPFNEAVDFLTPGQSQGGTTIKRGGNPGTRRNGELRSWCRVRRFHSPTTSAPINSLAASTESNSGNSPPQRSSTIFIGEVPTAGVAILPRKRVLIW